MSSVDQRICGLLGILGGFLLFMGDMLIYYLPDSTNLLLNMGIVSEQRIVLSGLTALFSAWCYTLGLGQVYFAFSTTKKIFRRIVVLSFGMILIAYGVIHAGFMAIATTSQLAVSNDLDLNSATLLARRIDELLRLFIYPLFALCSLVFITQVWNKKTRYPRWILFFFPLLSFGLKFFFERWLEGHVWVIVIGGYYNLMLILFFVASTIALWNQKQIILSSRAEP